LKKKAAEIGATTVLVMDDPDSTQGEEIEVIGIAYRDESIPVSKPSVSTSREPVSTTSAQTSSNTRRRRILQQMNSYNNDSKLDLSEPTPQRESTAQRASTAQREPSKSTARNSQQRENSSVNNASDAVELLNGRMIYGTIEEFEPDDFVSIRTNNGKIYEYSMDDVRRVQRGNTDRSSNRQNTNRTPARNNNYEDNNSNFGNRQNRVSNQDETYYADGGVSGYKGTFDAGYTLPMGVGEKGRVEVHTSHGYQLNEYLFVGVGLGLHIFSARDTSLKNNTTFPHYVAQTVTNGIITPKDSTTYMHGVDSSFMVFPVFLDIRGYLPMGESKITPFAALRLGYSFNLTDGFGGMGLFMNPSIGAKYNLSRNLGLTFTVGYSSQNYGGIPGKNGTGGYGFYYEKAKDQIFEAKNAGGITFQLGVEF
jgi:hypothetical protein